MWSLSPDPQVADDLKIKWGRTAKLPSHQGVNLLSPAEWERPVGRDGAPCDLPDLELNPALFGQEGR